MDTLLTTTNVTIGLAAVVLSLLAVAMAYVLGWANRVFHVEVDPRVEKINEALPGANCGGCGYVGCNEYAEAVAAGVADVTLCGPGGTSCAAQLAEIMGVDPGKARPLRAVVHCRADRDMRLLRKDYQGERTCAAANLVGGVQGCTYGCLGFGDCERSCDYDAIHVKNGVAVVDYEKCIGCKACARVCPRNIISMVPFYTERMLVIGCSNHDFGPDVKKVCTVGCTGCKVCAKNSDVFAMDENLPTIDYEAYDPDADVKTALDKCPMKGLVYVGKPPSGKPSLRTGEPPKGPARADFKTTVDDTDWWG